MSTPTVIERIISPEPVTRDDFGDSPARASADAPYRLAAEAHRRPV